MLWVDKYRPTSFDKMTLHPALSARLQRMVATGDLPHLLVYGPSGAGKKTRVMAMMRELFGAGAAKVRIEHRVFKNNSTSIDLTTLASNHHIEINPSDVGNNDRVVVQQLIKEIAQSAPLDAQGNRTYKVVILNEVDKLSRDAQQALRRTMEKYSSACRLILMCNSTSKVIEPIRSRCLAVRVPAPTHAEVVATLKYVCGKENLQIPDDFAKRIADASERNMRRAILCLEACKIDQYPFKPDQQIQPLDWEKFISDVARDMIEEQTPARLLIIRNKFYELLANCIPPEIIMRRVVFELNKKIDSELKHEVTFWAAFYESRMNTGSKVIFHLEAFAAKFMALYKRFVLNQFAMLD